MELGKQIIKWKTMRYYEIGRSLLQLLNESYNQSNKIIILYGARQTGKTTLSNDFLVDLAYTPDSRELKVLKVNADESRYLEILSSRDLNKMKLS